MIKLAYLGGGGHSRGNHLPALARYQMEHPGRVALSAFCDIDRDTSVKISREFGFASSFTDVHAMLASENFDAMIAVTPVASTASISEAIMRAGVPLLMEKPPATTPEGMLRLCDIAERFQSRVMVSMNRRFDPALAAALDWRKGRPLYHLRACVLRHNRREPGFVTDSALHCVDAMRYIAGEVREFRASSRRVDGVAWYTVDFEFTNGATGFLEILPTCGCQAEIYEMHGGGYRAVARVAEFDEGIFQAWENATLVQDDKPLEGMPLFIRNGTYAETVAFLAAVKEGTGFHPTLEEVRPSVDICHALYKKAGD